MMLRPKSFCCQSCKWSLVVKFLAAKTNCERLYPFASLLSSTAQNHRRIYSPAEQHAQRHIADQMVANGFLQNLPKGIARLNHGLAGRDSLKLQVPIPLTSHLPPVYNQIMARLQLTNPFYESFIARQI